MKYVTSVYTLTTDQLLTSHGHISVMGHPTHFLFGSGVGFQGLVVGKYFKWLGKNNAQGVMRLVTV